MSPNGTGATHFWDAIRNGTSGIASISLFDPEGLPCRVAGQIKQFDAENYLPAVDVRRVGRSVPFAIAATREALQSAKISCEAMDVEAKRAWGVILGSGAGAPDFTEEQYRLFFNHNLSRVSAYNIASSTMGAVSSEVSMHFGFRGPSHVLSTGCTSSTDAIGYAYNSIRSGFTNQLVTGGVDATITPGILRGFCIMRVVSSSYNEEPSRASRPFDRSRDGFVLGEGAWIFVIEEREHARARGATIYGEILGYGSTCDAYHRVRLDPSAEEPARAMQLAIEDAGIAKDEIGYVALHGTSTELNDKTETSAAKLCFGQRAYDIPMSSIKSMIGHPQGASGAAGVAATILGINHGFLPPTINYEAADPECDLNYIPNRGLSRSIDIALCNCIGFGSKNSALIIARGDLPRRRSRKNNASISRRFASQEAPRLGR